MIDGQTHKALAGILGLKPEDIKAAAGAVKAAVGTKPWFDREEVIAMHIEPYAARVGPALKKLLDDVGKNWREFGDWEGKNDEGLRVRRTIRSRVAANVAAMDADGVENDEYMMIGVKSEALREMYAALYPGMDFDAPEDELDSPHAPFKAWPGTDEVQAAFRRFYAEESRDAMDPGNSFDNKMYYLGRGQAIKRVFDSLYPTEDIGGIVPPPPEPKPEAGPGTAVLHVKVDTSRFNQALDGFRAKLREMIDRRAASLDAEVVEAENEGNPVRAGQSKAVAEALRLLARNLPAISPVPRVADGFAELRAKVFEVAREFGLEPDESTDPVTMVRAVASVVTAARNEARSARDALRSRPAPDGEIAALVWSELDAEIESCKRVADDIKASGSATAEANERANTLIAFRSRLRKLVGPTIPIDLGRSGGDEPPARDRPEEHGDTIPEDSIATHEDFMAFWDAYEASPGAGRTATIAGLNAVFDLWIKRGYGTGKAWTSDPADLPDHLRLAADAPRDWDIPRILRDAARLIEAQAEAARANKSRDPRDFEWILVELSGGAGPGYGMRTVRLDAIEDYCVDPDGFTLILKSSHDVGLTARSGEAVVRFLADSVLDLTGRPTPGIGAEG